MRLLIIVSVFVAAAAIAAPKLLARYMPADRSETGDSAAPETLAGEAAGSGARGASARHVEIKANRDGHFYVEAEINFRPVRLIVDTGATTIALRRSDAEAAGIRPVAADFTFPVSTANGATWAAEAELDRVSVDAVEVSGVRALVLPDEQLSVSLLGGTFLNRLARYEVERGRLILEN